MAFLATLQEALFVDGRELVTCWHLFFPSEQQQLQIRVDKEKMVGKPC